MIHIQHTPDLQSILDYIDTNIKNEINAVVLAEKSRYSAYHFSRVFTRTIGIPLRSYVTWRRLQYALYDLSLGKKVIDVAMEYSFETHGGFTKAFIRWFGFPPSLCRSRLTVNPPIKPDVKMLTNKFLGGNAMHPHIIELTPFSAVGYPSRHKADDTQKIANDPTLWNTLDIDFGSILTKLYDAFTLSKHFEICLTYFPTPPTGDLLDQVVQDTWNDIFLHWLTQSEFEYDDTRRDFSYHDYRDHGWYFGGKLQIDFCIPIRQREEEMRKSQLRAGR
ncbi:MAG: AraC family transcriptional regulator [Defluviitaleaceae bacterium]|nr:AraC family transcriptional regulator [Defluviitaleaceae bacterium]